MPILWRYLLGHYLKVLTLCLLSFIAILLTTRLDEIAHFATMGPEAKLILAFILHQIPYILPIALPISCLISSLLLVQRLSQTHELTALRAAGLSLRNIICPILLAAVFLGLCNFYVISELSTKSHLTTGKLKNELRSLNPLLLLHNKHILKLKGIFFHALGATRMGEQASDVVVALPNKNNKSIHLLLAKQLVATSSDFVGKGVTLITSVNREDSGALSPRQYPEFLFTENIAEAFTTSHDFSQLIYKKVWSLNNDHLRLPLLLVRLADQQQNLPQEEGEALKQLKKEINRGFSEILRRISVAAAVVTFTLMGIAFGMSVSRIKSQWNLIIVLALTALYLASFFSGKNFDHFILTAALCYLIPHALIIALSLWKLKRITAGC